MSERKEQKKTISNLTSTINTQKSVTKALTDNSISAEGKLERKQREAKMSVKRSHDVTKAALKYKTGLKEAQGKVRSLESRVEELQAMPDESNKKLQSAQLKIPIRVIKKERIGKMEDLIMEQLVTGTPLTSVRSNIISFITKVAPHIEIKELPSL